MKMDVLDPEEEGVVATPDSDALMSVTKGEVDIQIATAKKYPRSVAKFKKDAMSLVTLDKSVAEACNYLVPRGGKKIPGPSARFAEIVRSEWGNCRVQGMPVAQDDKFVTVRGMFWDIERNVAIAIDVRRRITTKDGQTFNDDMIGVTTAAATSIATRNATLQGIPKAYWEPIYNAALATIRGDVKTLQKRRADWVAFFGQRGVSEARLFKALGVHGLEDITLDHMPDLAGFKTALEEGRAIDEVFPLEGEASPKGTDVIGVFMESLTPDMAQQVNAAAMAVSINAGNFAVLIRKHKSDGAAVLADLLGMVAHKSQPKADTPAPAPDTTSAPVTPVPAAEIPNASDISF